MFSLKVYPSPENFTGLLVAMVVTFCMSAVKQEYIYKIYPPVKYLYMSLVSDYSGCIDFKLTVTYNNNNNKNIRRSCFLNNFGAVILRGKVCIGQSKCGAKNKGTTELWGNFMEPLFFRPHFHGGIQALPCKIMEKYRLCTTKSDPQFQGPK